jgi:hypothetical protein
VPTNDGGRLHHAQSVLPAGPQPGQGHPQRSVTALEADTSRADGPLQDANLMAQGEVFERQLALGLEKEWAAASRCQIRLSMVLGGHRTAANSSRIPLQTSFW